MDDARLNRLETLVRELQGKTLAPAVTALPASPADGQEVYLLADGVVWHLRYRAESTNARKWEFVGGPPLAVDANDAFSTASVSASPAGTSVAIPLAGVYEIEAVVMRVLNTIADTGNTMSLSGAGFSGNTAEVRSGATSNNWRANLTLRRRIALTTGTLQMVVGVTAGTGSFEGRYIRATPVRL